MSIDRIVVGIDFSPGSDAAVEQALQIAGRLNASLCLVHAYPPLEAGDLPTPRAATLGLRRAAEVHLAADRAALDELGARLSRQGRQVTQRLVADDGYSAIVSTATDVGADLIVVGSRGRTGFQRFVLGSVAEHVVRTARADVLIARPGGDVSSGYQRILVPTDFSASAARALEVAAILAAAGATIDLLHCWQVPYLCSGTRESIDEASRWVRADAEKGFNEVRDRWTGPATLRCHMVQQPPAQGIQKFLDDHPQDLVVTGSHGKGGIRRFLLGSVAETTVRYSPCSVLVARGPA